MKDVTKALMGVIESQEVGDKFRENVQREWLDNVHENTQLRFKNLYSPTISKNLS